ncbi:hypothetical protein D3C80_1005500 [compost metagenome]
MVCRDLHTNRNTTLRIDRELDWRLTSTRTQPAGFHQKALAHQLIDYVGDSLRRQLRKFGDVSTTKRAVTTHNIKHHPAIVIAASLGIFPDGHWMSADRVNRHFCNLFRFQTTGSRPTPPQIQ